MTALPSQHPRFPQHTDSLASQCDHALQLVLAAQRQKVIDAPTIALTDFVEEPGGSQKLKVLNTVRFSVIAKQLWLLGYLDDEPRKNISPSLQETAQFQKRVRQFQRDAGLKQDGWLGAQVWKTLQQLVSFETPITPSKWQRADGSFPTAFNRAIQLRLWAYGLAKQKPAFSFAGLRKKHIEKVKQTLNDLTGGQYNLRGWRTLLLNSDAMLAYAAETIKQPQRLNWQAKDKLRGVLISIARVELWLLGFSININNQDNYRVENFGVKRTSTYRAGRRVRLANRSVQLQNALTEFWQTLVGLPETEAKQQAKLLSVKFYEALQSPKVVSTESTTFDEIDFSKQAAKKLHTTKAIDGAYAHAKRLGMKLWDGVKRLWRWFVNGVKKIVQVADNLVRGFFRFASKGYNMVRKALLALSASLRQYTRGRLDNTGKSIVLIKKDFDFLIAANNHDATLNTRQAITSFSTQFLFSSKIVSLIIDALTSAIYGVAGWAKFLFVLVKRYRELVPLYRALQSSYISR